MPNVQIVIVDDHPLFRDALRESLRVGFDGADIREAGTLGELTEMLDASREVDLVLLDLAMPGVRGLSGLLLLRAQFPEIPVVIVSARDDMRTVRGCIDVGASGYIPKSLPVDKIRSAVSAVLAGDVWIPPDYDLDSDREGTEDDVAARVAKLTPQQVRVLIMLGEGLLNKQIAFQLNVSEATVKAHVSAILQKLNVDSRTQAVIAISSIDRANWQPAS